MTNTIKINALNQEEAIVSRAFLNKALTYGTTEYHLWKKFKAENPEVVRLVSRTNKKNANRKVNNRHLTYKKMENHLALLPHAETLLEQFEYQKKLSLISSSPYQFVKKWFIENAYDNDMNLLQKDIEAGLYDSKEVAESEATA